mmetsp:Transcript_11985/g.18892  ORF Transcript_11985/g.18892 Transcript_11985/m.18892 type:complete len:250 (+) Transcript_11985:155-904(+)
MWWWRRRKNPGAAAQREHRRRHPKRRVHYERVVLYLLLVPQLRVQVFRSALWLRLQKPALVESTASRGSCGRMQEAGSSSLLLSLTTSPIRKNMQICPLAGKKMTCSRTIKLLRLQVQGCFRSVAVLLRLLLLVAVVLLRLEATRTPSNNNAMKVGLCSLLQWLLESCRSRKKQPGLLVAKKKISPHHRLPPPRPRSHQDSQSVETLVLPLTLGGVVNTTSRTEGVNLCSVVWLARPKRKKRRPSHLLD